MDHDPVLVGRRIRVNRAQSSTPDPIQERSLLHLAAQEKWRIKFRSERGKEKRTLKDSVQIKARLCKIRAFA